MDEEATELTRVPLYFFEKERRILVGEALVDESSIRRYSPKVEEDLPLIEVTASRFTFGNTSGD